MLWKADAFCVIPSEKGALIPHTWFIEYRWSCSAAAQCLLDFHCMVKKLLYIYIFKKTFLEFLLSLLGWAQQFKTLFSLGQQVWKSPHPPKEEKKRRRNKSKEVREHVWDRKGEKDANRGGANRSEQAIEQREGREKRDLQGRVRAEVLGGRSKAVISWWIRGVHYRPRAGGRRDEGWRRRRKVGGVGCRWGFWLWGESVSETDVCSGT